MRARFYFIAAAMSAGVEDAVARDDLRANWAQLTETPVVVRSSKHQLRRGKVEGLA